METRIYPTVLFKRKIKRLLSKFATLRASIDSLEQEILQNPFLGTSYGANIYKIRLADVSKGKGKSGGFRVVTYVVKQEKDRVFVYLITILDKSEEASISKADIRKLIKTVL